MADFLAGCALERLPSARALASARFVEYAPRSPLPSYATLARTRKAAATFPELSLVAPREVWMTPRGPLRSGPELDRGLEWLLRASDILSAFAIVIATGAELTTGERDRELLARFLDRLRPCGRTLVIAPRGLWEPEHAEPFASASGALYGFDPLEHDAPTGDIVYARVRPMGARPRLTEGHLAQIAARLAASGATRAFVSVESEQCVRDVKRLARELSEAAEGAAAYTGRLGGIDEELDEGEEELEQHDELEEGEEELEQDDEDLEDDELDGGDELDGEDRDD